MPTLICECLWVLMTKKKTTKKNNVCDRKGINVIYKDPK